MPKGTKVEKMYTAMREQGMDKGKAARIAQAKTGLSLATGKKPKGDKHMRGNPGGHIMPDHFKEMKKYGLG